MFKGLANLASLMKDFQQIQGRTAEMQEALGRVRVEGSAGGEMVVVKANGLQQISEIKIDRTLLENPDVEMLEDLLVSATNQALEKAREATSAEMAKLTSNLQLPGLSEMMSKLGLGQGPDGEHA
jgi:DNA-binding YbaB/EbfC family protein